MENHRIDQVFQVAPLIRKYVEGTLNDEERRTLETWLDAGKHNRKLFDEIIHSGDLVGYEQAFLNVDTTDALERFKTQHSLQEQPERRLWQRSWPVAAAAILVFLAIGLGWFYLSPSAQEGQLLVSQYGDDVPAGGDRATLTLSDGRVVRLNTDKQGVIIGDDLTYNDGTSLVDMGTTKDQPAIALTLATPRGGQYQTTLSDGTKVWLNAGSSLKYPLHFSENQRSVVLEGEAYFDVSHDADRPFIVHVNDTEIRVLGTQFNVNSYSRITATLVEGSVKISNASGQQLLKPGEEAWVDESITVHPADIGKVTAWKDGYFYFKSDNIVDIMGQLARWYDIEVKYEGSAPDKGYNGRIRREVNLSKVLDMLTYLSGAQFIIADREITVTFK